MRKTDSCFVENFDYLTTETTSRSIWVSFHEEYHIVFAQNSLQQQVESHISGRVDKASATETVQLGSIPGRVKWKITKICIHSFFAWLWLKRDSVKPSSCVANRRQSTKDRKVLRRPPGQGNLANETVFNCPTFGLASHNRQKSWQRSFLEWAKPLSVELALKYLTRHWLVGYQPKHTLKGWDCNVTQYLNYQ